MSKLTPCDSCPWRVETVAGDIPAFRIEKARALLDSTCGPDDGFRSIMACHMSYEEHSVICLGYLVREGHRNIGVRLDVYNGKCPNPMAVDAAIEAAGIELHETYAEVLEKLEESV